MTTRKRNAKQSAVEVVAGDRDLIKAQMKEALQEVLEGEMTDFLGAAPRERTDGRQGYRAGYYGGNLVTRIGKLELRIPRDRSGEFSTGLFERYARSEKALVAALAEMYVQGVSTRKGHHHHRRTLRTPLLGERHQRDQQEPGCDAGQVCRTAAGRDLPLPDPRCLL